MDVTWDVQKKDMKITINTFSFYWSHVENMNENEIDHLKKTLNLRLTDKEEIKGEIRILAHNIYYIQSQPKKEENNYGKTAKGKDVTYPESFHDHSSDTSISVPGFNTYHRDSNFSKAPEQESTDKDVEDSGINTYRRDSNFSKAPPHESEMHKTKEQCCFENLKVFFLFLV